MAGENFQRGSKERLGGGGGGGGVGGGGGGGLPALSWGAEEGRTLTGAPCCGEISCLSTAHSERKQRGSHYFVRRNAGCAIEFTDGFNRVAEGLDTGPWRCRFRGEDVDDACRARRLLSGHLDNFGAV